MKLKSKDIAFLEEAYSKVQNQPNKSVQELNTVEEIKNRIKEIEQEMEEDSDVFSQGSYAYDTADADLQFLYSKLEKLKKESDESFFRDKPEPSKDEREQAMAHLQTMSYILNDVGSRLSSAYRRLKNNGTVDEEIKKMLAKDGEELVVMSSEIEDIYEKYLSV